MAIVANVFSTPTNIPGGHHRANVGLAGFLKISFSCKTPGLNWRLMAVAHDQTSCGGLCRTVFLALKAAIHCACQRKLPVERLKKMFKSIMLFLFKKNAFYHRLGTLCRSTSLFTRTCSLLLLKFPKKRATATSAPVRPSNLS